MADPTPTETIVDQMCATVKKKCNDAFMSDVKARDIPEGIDSEV